MKNPARWQFWEKPPRGGTPGRLAAENMDALKEGRSESVHWILGDDGVRSMVVETDSLFLPEGQPGWRRIGRAEFEAAMAAAGGGLWMDARKAIWDLSGASPTPHETFHAAVPTEAQGKMLHSLVCQHCGSAFQSKRRHAKFCSDLCRLKNHRGEPVVKPEPEAPPQLPEVEPDKPETFQEGDSLDRRHTAPRPGRILLDRAIRGGEAHYGVSRDGDTFAAWFIPDSCGEKTREGLPSAREAAEFLAEMAMEHGVNLFESGMTYFIEESLGVRQGYRAYGVRYAMEVGNRLAKARIETAKGLGGFYAMVDFYDKNGGGNGFMGPYRNRRAALVAAGEEIGTRASKSRDDGRISAGTHKKITGLVAGEVARAVASLEMLDNGGREGDRSEWEVFRVEGGETTATITMGRSGKEWRADLRVTGKRGTGSNSVEDGTDPSEVAQTAMDHLRVATWLATSDYALTDGPAWKAAEESMRAKVAEIAAERETFPAVADGLANPAGKMAQEKPAVKIPIEGSPYYLYRCEWLEVWLFEEASANWALQFRWKADPWGRGKWNPGGWHGGTWRKACEEGTKMILNDIIRRDRVAFMSPQVRDIQLRHLEAALAAAIDNMPDWEGGDE